MKYSMTISKDSEEYDSHCAKKVSEGWSIKHKYEVHDGLIYQNWTMSESKLKEVVDKKEVAEEKYYPRFINKLSPWSTTDNSDSDLPWKL